MKSTIRKNVIQAISPSSLQTRLQTSVQQAAVAEAIERSWRRCLAQGLSSTSPTEPQVITAQELAYRQEKNALLLTQAQPEMMSLSEQIAHTRSMVILTDAEGVILHTMGDASFLSQAQQIALAPGASWSEEHRGTNAIGTALIEQSPIAVQGAEHFMAYHHSLSCAAVPIFGAQNELLATLDVSNDFNMPQQHTLALVKMAAQMIENRLFGASYAADITLHFHSRPEFIGTLWEGIAVFSQQGQFIATNRSGQFQLNLEPQMLDMQIHFNQLFDLSLRELLAKLNGEDESVIFPLRFMNGARIYARVVSSHKRPNLTAVAQPALTQSGAANLDLLNSGDAQVATAIRQVKQVLSRDIPILILGETGVGKDILARAVHDASNRHKGPWVAVNCAALPEGLIEAELFGYEEGAFTGAKRKGGMGKIEQAHGGTLFLDEIGDMPLSLQARLLRVLQERTITPLGGSKAKAVDFALISATNQKLKDKVERGEFRSDLYYRLNGLSVSLPALRDRTDLAALIRIILVIEQAEQVLISPSLMQFFDAHPWPGNIRQLHNVLRTAIALADGAPLSLEHLTQDFIAESQVSCASLSSAMGLNPAMVLSQYAQQDLGGITLEAIRQAMSQHQGNVSAVARQLGISRNTLYRKLKQLGLD
jgi:sigma-54 dependent transcriptional regulator, acetoin dehydrogenase operon transcriptional activator AcoR